MDVPRFYTWRNKSWNKRKQGRARDVTAFPGVKEAHILGRVYIVNLRQGECF